jgi:TonB family protein
MFSNLIESSSHRGEFKRRGSFLLFTTASYFLFFVIAGVASIYAYEARMEDRNLELVTMMSLVDLPTPDRPRQEARQPDNPRTNPGPQLADIRRNLVADVNRSDIPPKDISTRPNPDLPVRDGVITTIGDRDFNAARAGGLIGPPGEGGLTAGTSTRVVVDVDPPPPAPIKPKPVVVTRGVITGEALSLPKPVYPQAAKLIHIQGKVSIQVLIDETGKVVSARAVDGPPLLKQAAEKAAFLARFSPTRLSDQPVKVSGVITYNFVLEQ